MDFENPKAGRAGWNSTGILRNLLLNLRPGGRVLDLLLDLLLILSFIVLSKSLNKKALFCFVFWPAHPANPTVKSRPAHPALNLTANSSKSQLDFENPKAGKAGWNSNWDFEEFIVKFTVIDLILILLPRRS